MKTTADRIKEGMEIREMKQVDIIERTGINKGALSSYISGKYVPKQNNIYKIAKALNVNEAWIMGYDVPMERNVMPQADESPVLKAIYNSDLKDSKIGQEFVMKKLADSFQFEPDDFTLLMEFKKLNTDGKKEAINRISELTYIPKYTEEFNKLNLVAEDQTSYFAKNNTENS